MIGGVAEGGGFCQTTSALTLITQEAGLLTVDSKPFWN